MDYGKKNARKNEKPKKKSTKAKRKFAVAVLRSILLCILVVIIGATIAAGLYAKNLIDQLPDISQIDVSPNGYQTLVYDAQGNEIETLAAAGANRSYVKIEDIPLDLQHAFVAIEDERFYEHNGIDVRGIIRAGFKGITSGHFSQGASTITQQLLKNNYFVDWMGESSMIDSVNRKIQEQYLAIQLEKVMDKNTILENYMNTINLGQNTLGVQAASERYFNKTVSELTLSESAVIAGITQNPSKYNPISNPEENNKRRSKVLGNMLTQGFITQDQYDEAMADDVYERIQIANAQSISNSTTSYFVDALTDDVYDDLVAAGYTEAQAYQMLYSGGLKIYSTQDPSVQSICDEQVNNADNYAIGTKYSFSYRLTVNKADGSVKNYSEQTLLSYYQSSNSSFTINCNSKEDCDALIAKYKSDIMSEGDTIADGGETLTYTLQPQVALTVMDQSTGAVVALVGGRGEKTASKTLNRATGITRQPGSTFKVIAAYAAALDAGGLSLASVQDDAPMTYANGTPLKNYDEQYLGYTSIRQGIVHSINVVAVKTLTEIGTGLGYQYVQDLGITTLTSGDNNQALALGGITNGVTNVELTAAYATIANSGYYNKPHFYTQVYDHSGNLLLDNTNKNSKKVLKDSTAWLLTSAMKDVMTQGTGTPANFEGMAVAGKSGTTTKNRDTVFAGFTPYYTCVIWGGYDDNTVQSNTSYSKAVWKAVMSRINFGKEYKDFTMPSSVVQVEVCRKSGKLPIPGVCDCDPRGSMVYTEYFDIDNVPTEQCDHHISGTFCGESGYQATAGCPSLRSGVFIVGAGEGSADSPYSISLEGASASCPLHSGANYNVTVTPQFPTWWNF